MKKLGEIQGITLVALVVTIIILLILAGISIASLTGNGLFEKAKLAKEKQENAHIEEDETLGDYENKIGKYIDNSRETVTLSKEEYDILKNSNSYSLEEKEIGTWLDGKKLYKKAIKFSNYELGNGKTYAHGIEGIDTVFVSEFYYDYGYGLINGLGYIKGELNEKNGNSFPANPYATDTVLGLSTTVSWAARTYRSYIFVLEYTKK